MFEKWITTMKRSGLKLNNHRTEPLVSGKPLETRREAGKYPCGFCGSGVGSKSVLCIQ